MRSAELAITSLISNKRELLKSFKNFEARNTSAKSEKIRANSKKKVDEEALCKSKGIENRFDELQSTRLSHCGWTSS